MKQKLVIIFFSFFLLLSPAFAQARGLVPCGGYTDSGAREPVCTVNDVFYLFARVINWLISLAGIYAVIQIVIAGFFLTISQGNQEAITKHQGHLTNVIIGFVIVMIAFVSINTLVNTVLQSKCKIDLSNPLTYLTVQSNYNTCSTSK